ncbi:polysaccharide biosynthesis/export family protein [Pseudoalteromonas sp.]|uniref:polysaccharide biosynthesis/export family protein n=1 Tax=Pseudoalteromonas sp. TaxID=53249 RepID=UPI003561C909
MVVYKLLLVFITSLLLCVTSHANEQIYRFGPGDTIRVSVYLESDLYFEGQISQQGGIDFPLLGSLTLKGLTQQEAKRYIEQQLKDGYLVSPNVSVRIVSYRPFFIYGEVRKPGSYPYQPNITLEQAIVLAGGLKDRASREQWTIQRGEKSNIFKASANSIVQPGDVIKVQKSFF